MFTTTSMDIMRMSHVQVWTKLTRILKKTLFYYTYPMYIYLQHNYAAISELNIVERNEEILQIPKSLIRKPLNNEFTIWAKQVSL